MADQGILFDLPPPAGKPLKFKPHERPLWTENKARLIERYLFYFVLVTKHGAYIDGFAGPQNYRSLNSWAAKQVLESKPALLREFWLCEIDAKGVAALEKLKTGLPVVRNRSVEVVPGDFNETVHRVLNECKITDRTAAFCLLDQRTFECHWSTVQTLSKFKKGGHKIELFYFLGSGWLDRSLKGTKHVDKIERWWGNSDWRKLRGMRNFDRAQLVTSRFRDELGYVNAYSWPIYKKGSSGGRIMYHMVHATDHPEAPKLMHRAYFNATKAREPIPQLELELGQLLKKSPRA